MTEKLYYSDPYLKSFTANIASIVEKDGKYHIILDRTAFYPEGGGQPCDLGTVGGIDLETVQEEDGEIHHIAGQKPEAIAEVSCQLDWSRRFDHMQQHLGQHLLSAALHEIGALDTVGFHMGSSVTIDMHRPASGDLLCAAEREANAMIAANLRVSALYPSGRELDAMKLRKQPQVDGDIRLVCVEGRDFTPCGGTHPSTTAEVGLIKILNTERHKGGTRISFVCGGRALRDYSRKHDTVREISALLSAGESDLSGHVACLLENMKTLQKENAQFRQAALAQQAEELLAGAESISAVRVVISAFENMEFEALRFLASRICEIKDAVALLAVRREGTVKAVFACSGALGRLNMAALLKDALAGVSGKGGGSACMAQGSFSAGNKEELTAFLDAARRLLGSRLG